MDHQINFPLKSKIRQVVQLLTSGVKNSLIPVKHAMENSLIPVKHAMENSLFLVKVSMVNCFIW